MRVLDVCARDLFFRAQDFRLIVEAAEELLARATRVGSLGMGVSGSSDGWSTTRFWTALAKPWFEMIVPSTTFGSTSTSKVMVAWVLPAGIDPKKARKQSMQSAKVRKVTGVHDVFLVFVGKKGQVQVKSFNFVAPASKS